MSTSFAGNAKQRKDDLKVVVKYIKDDLFAKVKFIYDPKVDLAVGGKIYTDYKRKCKDQLGSGTGLSTEGHDTYMESVWTMAMTKHMQKNALAQKRSAVYTVMQNKFSGKFVPSFCSDEVIYIRHLHLQKSDLCQVCVDKKCVMLSLESIERRLENPKAYYIFYEFFYKAAVGEVQWKECMDSSEVRIGNDTTEAFALLLFANNYKAWLYEEKVTHGEALWTEYDSIGKDSIVDRLLLDQEFVLEEGPGELLVCDTTKQTYKKAVKARNDWLAELRRLPVCAEMKTSWQHTAIENENEAGEPASYNKKEREKKRRKVMKGLKKWTGLADNGERKFKGWSDSGHKAFEQWTMSIKNDVRSGTYTLWEKAFREVNMKQQEARRSENKAETKFAVNRSVVWEL
jgi:hypothetical protein